MPTNVILTPPFQNSVTRHRMLSSPSPLKAKPSSMKGHIVCCFSNFLSLDVFRFSQYSVSQAMASGNILFYDEHFQAYNKGGLVHCKQHLYTYHIVYQQRFVFALPQICPSSYPPHYILKNVLKKTTYFRKPPIIRHTYH